MWLPLIGVSTRRFHCDTDLFGSAPRSGTLPAVTTGSSQGERPTLEDVAAYAGVSRSTASRALNDDNYVSSRSREVVLAAAAEIGRAHV